MNGAWDWFRQTPVAVESAEKKAKINTHYDERKTNPKITPNLRPIFKLGVYIINRNTFSV